MRRSLTALVLVFGISAPVSLVATQDPQFPRNVTIIRVERDSEPFKVRHVSPEETLEAQAKSLEGFYTAPLSLKPPKTGPGWYTLNLTDGFYLATDNKTGAVTRAAFTTMEMTFEANGNIIKWRSNGRPSNGARVTTAADQQSRKDKAPMAPYNVRSGQHFETSAATQIGNTARHSTYREVRERSVRAFRLTPTRYPPSASPSSTIHTTDAAEVTGRNSHGRKNVSSRRGAGYVSILRPRPLRFAIVR